MCMKSRHLLFQLRPDLCHADMLFVRGARAPVKPWEKITWIVPDQPPLAELLSLLTVRREHLQVKTLFAMRVKWALKPEMARHFNELYVGAEGPAHRLVLHCRDAGCEKKRHCQEYLTTQQPGET